MMGCCLTSYYREYLPESRFPNEGSRRGPSLRAADRASLPNGGVRLPALRGVPFIHRGEVGRDGAGDAHPAGSRLLAAPAAGEPGARGGTGLPDYAPPPGRSAPGSADALRPAGQDEAAGVLLLTKHPVTEQGRLRRHGDSSEPGGFTAVSEAMYGCSAGRRPATSGARFARCSARGTRKRCRARGPAPRATWLGRTLTTKPL